MVAEILQKILPPRIYQKYIEFRRKSTIRKFQKDPKALAIKDYKKVFGEKPDLRKPKDLIEKIIWLQFNTDTSLWTTCADKYRVRKYVIEKGLENILCKLYGVWNNAEDIDFNSLPEKFVLKTNNSCGQIMFVKDRKNFDADDAKKRLSSWLKQGYGYYNGQVHYTRILPCVIAEEYLEAPEDEGLTDYKIWCFNGQPECILVCSDRVVCEGKYYLSMYNTEWENISSEALNQSSNHFSGVEIARPANFDKMLDYARRLSEGFPEVRVDLYNLNGRIVFGELTFTTGFGSYKKSFYEYLGSKVKLPKK